MLRKYDLLEGAAIGVGLILIALFLRMRRQREFLYFGLGLLCVAGMHELAGRAYDGLDHAHLNYSLASAFQVAAVTFLS